MPYRAQPSALRLRLARHRRARLFPNDLVRLAVTEFGMSRREARAFIEEFLARTAPRAH